MEIIDLLTKQLSITENQAKGGAGLILKRAKDVLGNKEFITISSKAPDFEILIRDLPATDNTVIGEVEKMFSIFGKRMGNLGSAAGVRAGFLRLGLPAEMIEKFQAIMLSFIQNKGDIQARNSLEKAFSIE